MDDIIGPLREILKFLKDAILKNIFSTEGFSQWSDTSTLLVIQDPYLVSRMVKVYLRLLPGANDVPVLFLLIVSFKKIFLSKGISSQTEVYQATGDLIPFMFEVIRTASRLLWAREASSRLI